MKKLLVQSFLMISILTLFTACPYESGVPIDKPSVKVYDNLIGKWIKGTDEEAENPTYFVINKIDNYLFNIQKNEFNSYDSVYTQSNYTAYISTIGNTDFLNVQESGSETFYLHKMILDNDMLTLYEITDNIDEKFESSKELKDFIEKNMEYSFFYNKDEEIYYKQ
jgi:hypothetical protein